MKIKKLLAVLLTAALSVGCLAACGQETNKPVESNPSESKSTESSVTPDESKSEVVEEKHDDVTLHYYIAGFADQKDADKVYTEVNELIQTIYPWISVEFHVSNQADYPTHMALAQTSGDPIDIIGTFGTSYQSEMANGSYMDITEYLNDYPELMSALPDFAYGWGQRDGKTYGFPNWQQCNYANQSIAVDKEIADKYAFDVNKVNELIQSEEFFNPEVYDLISDFLAAAHADGAKNLIIQTTGGLSIQTRGYESVSGPIYFAINDESCQLLNIWETNQVKEYLEAANEWKAAGYVPGDIATSDKYYPQNVKGNNMYSLMIGGNAYVPNFPDLRLKNWGRDLYFMQTMLSEDQYYIGYSYAAGLTAVGATSEYPEDALRVIELLYTNEELQNMLVYGLEGDHYTKNADGTIHTLEYDSGQANAESSYGMMKFTIGNSGLTWINQSFTKEMYDWAFTEMPANAKPSNLIGFAPDTTAVSAQLGQVNAVVKEYANQLCNVSCDNWETVYEEFLGKLDSAGIDAVIDELQKQVDAFLATK